MPHASRITHHVPRIAFATLGCKVNQSETDALICQFTAAGYQMVAFDEEADVYVVNTCTVTHVGDRKSRQLLRRAARRNPRALVVAAGCAVTADPAGLRALPEVGLLVPSADKPRLLELIEQSAVSRQRSTVSGQQPGSFRTRALVKVHDGCADRCTYCIVPLARGEPRSRPLPDVLAEVQAHCAAGRQEIVLTGIHLGSYGHDLGHRAPGLADLVQAILAETDVPRLRLSSIEPQDFSPHLLALWENPRVCRHLALPLQSGCDATLVRMGRRYTAANYAVLVQQVRAAVPQIALTTDVIVGFPGETAADHAASLEFTRAMEFARIHVFPYSRRRGTPAAAMPNQVPPTVQAARAGEFRALAAESGRRYRAQFVGQMTDVLWEAPNPAAPGQWAGYTDTYIRVTTYLPEDVDLTGWLTPVCLTAVTAEGMTAQIAASDPSLPARSVVQYP